jgi:hypothetical protein
VRDQLIAWGWIAESGEPLEWRHWQQSYRQPRVYMNSFGRVMPLSKFFAHE